MRTLSRLVLFAALAPASYPQSLLYEFHGDSAADEMGRSVSGAGDVNADGHDDLIVGARRDDDNGKSSGSARVFSGADGSILYTFYGDSGGDVFGHSVSGAGDVNADGHGDVIVSAPGDDNNGGSSGSVRVLSGMDGSVLFVFDGDSGQDQFGQSVSGAGDVNADGYDDMVVGAPYDDNNAANSGSVRVFSGLDGSVIYTFDGDSGGDLLGESVRGAGDVNGDGFDDVIAGTRWVDVNGRNSGMARIFSGFDGSILFTFHGDSPRDQFGSSVSGAGDVNADGFDDLLVGADMDDNNGTSSGSARVFSGLDGNLLYTFDGGPGDFFGRSVSCAGDLNRDGADDLIVGAPGGDAGGESSGSAWVFSGLDGSVLYVLDGESTLDFFGHSVSGAGDVDGDGFADLFVGAYGADTGGPESGSARVFSGGHTLGHEYCGPALPNSTGFSGRILASGSRRVMDNELRLAAIHLPPNQFGYFLMASVQAFVPLFGGSQGNLCIGLPLVRFSGDVLNSGPGGESSFQPDLTALPQGTVFQPGDTWNFQMWFRDTNPGPTSNTTNGLAVTFETSGDPAVQFPVTLLSRVEETVLLSVTVTLSQASVQDVVVPYTTGGTASYGVDWRVEEANPLVIPAGETAYPMAVLVAEDTAQEGNETCVITLGVPSGGVIGTALECTVTIVDDD